MKLVIARIGISVLLLGTVPVVAEDSPVGADNLAPAGTKRTTLTSRVASQPTRPDSSQHSGSPPPEPVLDVPQPDPHGAAPPRVQPGTETVSSAINYQINWQSINSGGGPTNSASYAANSTAGQAVIGEASSASYRAVAGYWYGASAVSCACDCHADPQCDGVVNVLDVVQAVNVAFRSWPPVFDPACPWERTDADCSGFTNVIDVVKFVNVAFRGGAAEENFCNPCP